MGTINQEEQCECCRKNVDETVMCPQCSRLICKKCSKNNSCTHKK